MPLFVISGMGGFIACFIVGALGILWFTLRKRYEFIVLTFIVTLILANSKLVLFTGYAPLRAFYVLFMLAFSLIIMQRQGYIERKVLYFFPFFIVALFASILFSPDILNSILSVLSYLFLVIVVFTFIPYVVRRYELQLYEHLIVLFVLIAIISLLGGYILFLESFIESGRLRGITGNPNSLALFCIMAYPFVDYYDSKKGSISERGILIAKGVLILCLFFSGSRTGYASFIVYLLLSTFIFKGVSGRSVAVAVGLAGLLVLLNLESLVNFFPGLSDIIRPESLASASGRLPSWMVAIDQINQQPWLGSGFEYSKYYMPHFAKVHSLEAGSWHGVWNSYLAFLMGVGIIGLAAYSFFVFGLIKSSSRSKMLIPILGLVLFSAMFESWMTSSLNIATPLFLIYFVIVSKHETKY